MDAFLVTVASGVIVALVGGIVGFYLNGLREKERPVREQRIKQHLRALDEMRAQCHSIVVAYESWRGKVVNLQPMVVPASEPLRDPSNSFLASMLPTTNIFESITGPLLIHALSERRVQPYRSTIHAKRNEAVALTKEGHDSLQEMKVLEGMYRAHKPYLESRTRDIFNSFHKEFTNQHALLSHKLENLIAMLRAEPLEEASVSDDPVEKPEQFSILQGRIRMRRPGRSDAYAKLERNLARVDELMANLTNAVNDEMRETAKLARNWDPGAHLRAFEMEAERVAGTRS